MATRTKCGFASACLIALGLAWGCGGSLGSTSGGESHFLSYCDDTCPDGLSCIAGVCTRGCVIDEDECGDLHSDAECTDSIEPGEVATCDVACTSDSHCESLGANYTCDSGQCRGGTSLSSSGNGPSSGGTASGGSSTGDPSNSGSGTSGTGGAMGESCVFSDHELPDGAVFSVTTACETCTCNDGGVTCESMPDGPCIAEVPVFPCPAGLVSDPVEVNSASFRGDQLILDVSYSGGCEYHDFGLCYEAELDAAGVPEYPVIGQLRLYHDDNLDPCLAIESTSLEFDLRPYAEYVKQELDVPGAVVIAFEFGLYAFGQLTCDEMGGAIGPLVANAAERSIDCAEDADCVIVDPELSCAPGCGSVMARAGEARFTDTMAEAGAALCGRFEANDCPTLAPPPPEECEFVATCYEGQCMRYYQ